MTCSARRRKVNRRAWRAGLITSPKRDGMIVTLCALLVCRRYDILRRLACQSIHLLLTTPMDDVTWYFTFVVWRNDDFSAPADEVERIPGVLPLEITATASVQADRPSLAWRRQFAALL
jgi:hypothetical protein